MSQKNIEVESENGEIIRGSYQEPFQLHGDLLNPTLMIFCHGFPQSHMKAYNDLFSKLQNTCAKNGMFSVSFDFRGNGTSDGAQENFTLKSALQDLQAIQKWARGKELNKFMVTGEGLGATISLLGLTEDIYAGIFFWPVFNTEDYANRNLDAVKHQANLDKDGYVNTDKGKIALPLLKELHDLDLTQAMNNVHYPCLIQQGAEDKIVPIEHLDMASAHFRSRRIELTSYQDGTHGLMKENHRKNLMYHYDQFIKKYA